MEKDAKLSPIRVTILDDSAGEKCEGRCGLDFSCPEVLESTTAFLKRAFGDRVELEFHDLAVPSNLPGWVAGWIEGKQMPLPALLVNGKLRISGYFDNPLIERVIQVEIEMSE